MRKTILGPDGRHLRQETLSLSSYTVTWFVDGRKLLQHATDLSPIGATLGCQTCATEGVPCDVRVVWDAQTHRMRVGCPHRRAGGHVEMDHPLEVEPLLAALGWTLYCDRCHAPLEGGNDPTVRKPVLTVTCPCTTREYRCAVV